MYGIKICELQTKYLASAGGLTGDTTLLIQNLTDIFDADVTMSAYFGTFGYATLEQGTSNERCIQFTGITQNGNGTATLTGISTIAMNGFYPFAVISVGLDIDHSGGTSVDFSNSPALMSTFCNIFNDTTIQNGVQYIFPGTTVNKRPRLAVDIDATLNTELITFGQLVRTVIAGAPAASPTVPGIAMVANSTDISTGNDQRNFMGFPFYVFVIPSQLDNAISSVTAKLKFGGNGTDGALNVTSGTTIINLANADTVIFNYSSINISVGATLAFSNPATTGTTIILKSSGTTSILGTIDASGIGAAGGPGGAVATNGSPGTTALGILDDSTHGGLGGVAAGQVGGNIYLLKSYYTTTNLDLYTKGIHITPGSGGGGGRGGSGGVGGDGGRGGGALYIESAGALNFTGTVNVSGLNGASTAAVAGPGGGGGGGAQGMAIILYNSAIATSGTILSSGGNGGDIGNVNSGTFGAGGSGAGSFSALGAAGAGTGVSGLPAPGTGSGGSGSGEPASAGGTGGGSGGGPGNSFVALNNDFA